MRLVLSSTLNTRDLGGYPTTDGRYIMYHVFYRSDVPQNLSEEDFTKLNELEINTVIDLRSDEEVHNKPSAFSTVTNIKYYHCKINGDGRIPNCESDVVDSYIEMLEGIDSMLNIIDILADCNGAALFHCAAGKDRTGVIAALLLSLVSVKKEDIIADYQMSGAYLYELMHSICKSNKDIKIEIVTPKIEYMMSFLNRFYEKYETTDQYLIKIGVSQEKITKLKSKLLGDKNARS